MRPTTNTYFPVEFVTPFAERRVVISAVVRRRGASTLEKAMGKGFGVLFPFWGTFRVWLDSSVAQEMNRIAKENALSAPNDFCSMMTYTSHGLEREQEACPA